MNSLQKVVAGWPKKEDFSALNLIVELSATELSCYWYGQHAGMAEGLVMYSLKEHSDPEVIFSEFDGFFQNRVFQQKHKSIRLFIRPAETLLMPADYYTSSGAAGSLDLMFGDVAGMKTRTEDLSDSAAKLCYRLPESWQRFLDRRFSGLDYRHSAACYLEKKKQERGTQLDCIFSPEHMLVHAYVSGHLQLMQHFEYRSPADAAYFLLAICHHLGLKPGHVTLKLSGTIDRESNLFNELFKYFSQIQWPNAAAGDSVAEAMNDIPYHYFDHLVSLAKCVS